MVVDIHVVYVPKISSELAFHANLTSLLVLIVIVPTTGVTLLGSVNLLVDGVCLVLMSHKVFVVRFYRRLCCGAIILVSVCCGTRVDRAMLLRGLGED